MPCKTRGRNMTSQEIQKTLRQWDVIYGWDELHGASLQFAQCHSNSIHGFLLVLFIFVTFFYSIHAAQWPMMPLVGPKINRISSSIRSLLLSSQDTNYYSFSHPFTHIHLFYFLLSMIYNLHPLTMAAKFYTLLLSTSLASNFVRALPTYPNNTVTWYSCSSNGTIPYTCGNLSVPLDYSDSSSSKTLNLSLVKVAATKEPHQGSILFNPGGPGIPGRSFVTALGSELLT